jgi:hypothetical protein
MGRPSPGILARLGKSIAKQSEGRAGEKYLPVGGRVRKLRAVEEINQPQPTHYPTHTTMDQTGHGKYSISTVRSLSDLDRPIAATDPQPSASFSARFQEP